MKIESLTPNLLRLMDPKARRALGKAGMTQEEALEAYCARNEKELQQQIVNLLKLRGVWFTTSIFGRRSTSSVGTPDINFPYLGKWISWEVKFGNGKLSEDQERVRDSVIRQGGEWRMIRSLDEARIHLGELESKSS